VNPAPAHIPAFSRFSAISELLVTAGVLFVVRRNWTRRLFPFGVFLSVALFEGLVNVMYMANRASEAASAPGHAAASALPTGMKIAFAAHGLLSLLAYLVFVVLGTFAHQEQGKGRWFFREHPVLTWTFLVGWMISIVSGEAIFALRYLV
jgi:arginine exporter protein ArgO